MSRTVGVVVALAGLVLATLLVTMVTRWMLVVVPHGDLHSNVQSEEILQLPCSTMQGGEPLEPAGMTQAHLDGNATCHRATDPSLTEDKDMPSSIWSSQTHHRGLVLQPIHVVVLAIYVVCTALLAVLWVAGVSYAQVRSLFHQQRLKLEYTSVVLYNTCSHHAIQLIVQQTSNIYSLLHKTRCASSFQLWRVRCGLQVAFGRSAESMDGLKEEIGVGALTRKLHGFQQEVEGRMHELIKELERREKNASENEVTLRGDVNWLKEELGRVRAEREVFADAKKETDRQVTVVRETLAAAQGELAAVKGDLAVVKGELGTMAVEVGCVREKEAANAAATRETDQQLTKVKGDLAAAQAATTVLKRGLTAVKGELAATEGKLTKVTEEMAAAKGGLATMEIQLGNLASSLSNFEEKVADEDAEEEVESQEATGGELEELNEEVEAIKEELAVVRSTLVQQDERVFALEEKYKTAMIVKRRV